MERLNQRLAEGDPAAFAELYDQLADRAYHYLLAETGSAEDAADLLQESFARLYGSRKRLRGVEHMNGYVFQVIRNEAKRWKGRRRAKPVTAELLFEPAVDATPSEQEFGELVAKAMNALPANYREVVELKTFARLSFAEISRVLGVPLGTAATWYRRALGQMRETLHCGKPE